MSEKPTVALSLNEPYESHYSASLPAKLADQAGTFQVAATEIDRGPGPGPSADSSPRGQGRDVEAWARRSGALIPEAEIDGVVIVDAKPDNFIKTVAGIVPIDLQMAQFTPDQ